jgi:hypothetical protein
MCCAQDSNLVSWTELYVYSVFIPAVLASCVPILDYMIAVLRIPDPTIAPSRIPDPGGKKSRIPDPTIAPSRIRIPGVKKHRIRIRNTAWLESCVSMRFSNSENVCKYFAPDSIEIGIVAHDTIGILCANYHLFVRISSQRSDKSGTLYANHCF